jgi:hypothetical protein
MIKTITTTITFKMPEEHEEHRRFCESMTDEWRRIDDGAYVSYSKKESVMWEVARDGQNN